MEASSFPSIEVSFRFHPPTALATITAPTPAVDQKPTATSSGIPSIVTDAPFAWITSYLPQPHTIDLSTSSVPSLLTSTIAMATTSAISTQQRDANTGKIAKIGIAVGITVAVILGLIMIGLAVMDYTRRFKRKKAKKQNRDSLMKGVWAGVRVEDVGRNRMTRTGSKRDGRWGKEWMGSKVALFERLGEGKQGGRSRKDDEPDWLPGWTPAHMPKDRRRVVSDGSMALSIMGQPVVPASFLGKEAR
jgi:hypothetical protein